jgi:hypothetical protein
VTPHLRGHVRAYVDRALPPAILHLYDRHVVVCISCRAAADQERRIVASLRSASSHVPWALRSALMELADTIPEPVSVRSSGPRIPLGPLAARGTVSWAVPEPVPTVSPASPALHRSPMRAAVVASLAAGASVAAAWGLAVSPLPGAVRTPARVPAGVASFGAVDSSLTLPAATRPAATRPDTASTRSSRLSAVVAPQFWVVSSSRSAVLRPSPAAPVRISLVTSAQSGP